MNIMAFIDATFYWWHAVLSPEKGDTEPAFGLTCMHGAVHMDLVDAKLWTTDWLAQESDALHKWWRKTLDNLTIK